MVEYTSDEQHIIDEAPEICVGEAQGWTDKLLDIFPALRNRNYSLYFYGGLVSLIGTWLQIVAESWLVLQLTNSPILIGLVTALAMIPTLIFSLFGGVIVDRYPKKKILLATQSASMILALVYGLLTVFHLINIVEIMILAFLLGTVSAIDNPARQAFTVEMVDKEHLASAISLNAATFNGARVIGPSIAGFIILWFGSGGAFILNGLSYIAAIWALLMMDVAPIIHPAHPNPLKAIKEGIQYSFSNPTLRTLLLLSGVTSIFGWSYSTELSVIAEKNFHAGASGLGYLYAAAGLGALLATFGVSYLAKKVNPIIFILAGNTLFAITIVLFSLVNNFLLALAILSIAGVGLLSQFAMTNTTIQHMVEDRYRGRVMSIYVIMFIGLSPLGSLENGFISDRFGTSTAIIIGAVIVFLFGILIFLRRGKLEFSQISLQTRKENLAV